MSRRLKHLKEVHRFFIEGVGSPGMEEIILRLVNEFILIHQKYKNKGHSRDSEIKQIEKHLNTSVTDVGISFKLHVHVHHYTKVYFNIYEYIAKLNNELKLPPASIKYNLTVEEAKVNKPNVPKIKQVQNVRKSMFA